MAKIFNYVYALIMFLSLFLMGTSGMKNGCKHTGHCPRKMCGAKTTKCRNNKCQCV
ncbi:putative Late nodulin [Medicago truncatula]|uniref:Late nodulin n=1 Tax=Medicago truncatula TaxID=3880 RepID=A7KHB6_MEDTR|nr:nodule-specific cysteine-rich peptide 192 [Medicago truncatula]AES75102.1 late nodulin [Medicago truncatula]RHN50682.1 putative Late nodulin [Medicago truncatula]